MENDRHPQRSYVGWVLGAAVLMAVIAVACGGPAATAEPSVQNTPQPTSTVAIAEPTPTTAAGATTPTPASARRDAPRVDYCPGQHHFSHLQRASFPGHPPQLL
jgi:hypothetical protein